MKLSPKSCSCHACRRGKHTKTGKYLINRQQRALRRASKNALRTRPEDAVLSPSPMGDYFD